MRQVVSRALQVYTYFLNFYNELYNIVNNFNNSLTIMLFEKQVFYKAYISQCNGYKTCYDYEGFCMKLIILMFRCLYIDGFFMIDHITFKSLKRDNINIIGYVLNGRVHYEIIIPKQCSLAEVEYNPIPEEEKKKLLYVFLNNKYDVTKYFNLLYDSIAKNKMKVQDLMDILFNMKYRGKLKPATFLYKMGICYDDGEYNENVFKAMDTFIITT